MLTEVLITTYPRKGTETGKAGTNSMNIMITTYPRKGTETDELIDIEHNLYHYNSSPQGDGNVVALRVLSNNGNITTSPRKGTVTRRTASTHMRCMHYNSSP